DGAIEQPPNGKIDVMQLNPGDTYVLESGGGGGFGGPLDRPFHAIQSDVRLGYVSVEAAQRDYQVMFDLDGNVDPTATARLREERVSADGPRTGQAHGSGTRHHQESYV